MQLRLAGLMRGVENSSDRLACVSLKIKKCKNYEAFSDFRMKERKGSFAVLHSALIIEAQEEHCNIS